MTTSDYYISTETESVYWLEGDNLMYTPINRNSTFDIEEADIVDEETMADDQVYLATNTYTTLGNFYQHIRECLANDRATKRMWGIF